MFISVYINLNGSTNNGGLMMCYFYMGNSDLPRYFVRYTDLLTVEFNDINVKCTFTNYNVNILRCYLSVIVFKPFVMFVITNPLS